MKKNKAKIGMAVRVENLDNMEKVPITPAMNEIRRIGTLGEIVDFVPGYNRNVCLVREIGTNKTGMFSYLELERTVDLKIEEIEGLDNE